MMRLATMGKRHHKIMGLAGLGKEIRQLVDARQYVDSAHYEWEKRAQRMIDVSNIESAQSNIDAFVSKWQLPLFELCRDNNQRLACWYLWLRYLLGLRSLRYLCSANDLCGCYTIARCCMEYDVAIAAVVKKPELGDAYIEYDVFAMIRHLEAMKCSTEAWKINELEQHMISRFGPDFAKKKKPNWHGGFPNLCKSAGRENELAAYHVLCQVTHGTISGMNVLDNLGLRGEHKTGEFVFKLLHQYTLQYLKTTIQVIETICPLWTQCKEDCKADLDRLANSIVGLT